MLLGSLIKACRLTNDRITCRLPIRRNLLEMILFETNCIFTEQPYLWHLYQAIFCLAYYGLMRIGEMMKHPKLQGDSDHSVKNGNFHIRTNKDKILVVLYTSKTHSKASLPQQIKISTLENDIGTSR